MLAAWANAFTSVLNRSPIRLNSAGDGTGLPRCSVRNVTTCPPTCRVGT